MCIQKAFPSSGATTPTLHNFCRSMDVLNTAQITCWDIYLQ